MPKYELMYIVGSFVSETDIPGIIDEVKKEIEKAGGLIEKHEELGKKKLAYEIKRTRNGYYVLVRFQAPAERINQLEQEIKSNNSIIRHMLINIDEALKRQAKDKAARAKMKPRKEPAEEKPEKKAKPKVEIDLDAEIEKALETDELK